MRNLKLTLEYDGTEFCGWQVQKGVRTAQGVLEKVLKDAFRQPLSVDGASRTDAGVHARGQVANFALPVPIPIERLRTMLNEKLPHDLFVRAVGEVPPAFHSRYDAVGKHYRYLIRRGGRAGAVLGRYSMPWRDALDLDRMRTAAAFMVGELDFAALASRSDPPKESTVRTVHEVRVTQEGSFVCLDVWGRSFLYKMVRTIAGTLLEVGRGRLSPDDIPVFLRSGDRDAAGPALPAEGLCLVAVFHDAASFEASRRLAGSVLETLVSSDVACPQLP